MRQGHHDTKPLAHQALDRAFFERDSVTVAKSLLGHHLVMPHPELESPVICRVVETEAYTQDDPACHAFAGCKGRAKTLFKQPGLSYVYFIYGMYFCLNVVTEPEGTAGAVLFRALEPLSPHQDFRTHGPGRLCKALGITIEGHNEVDLTNPASPLYLAPGDPTLDSQIITATRIGISKAQDYPWRFYIQDNPYISVKAKVAQPQGGGRGGERPPDPKKRRKLLPKTDLSEEPLR